ncbi:GntR family transcriptional regulator [Labrys sp. 22185]|uniref:GntR family transcriptional regulator n=1 Tax=Labrys sp. 22185 TaxID=3453888 RepID=UPI003F854FC3
MTTKHTGPSALADGLKSTLCLLRLPPLKVDLLIPISGDLLSLLLTAPFGTWAPPEVKTSMHHKARNQDHRILTEIRRRILSGDISSGTAINQAALAEELYVSTAPVRDALIRLVERGLVDHFEGRGYFVATPLFTTVVEQIQILRFFLTLSAQQRGQGISLARRQPLGDNPLDDHLRSFVELAVPTPFRANAQNIIDQLQLLVRANHDAFLIRQAERMAKLLVELLQRRHDRQALRLLVVIDTKLAAHFANRHGPRITLNA